MDTRAVLRAIKTKKLQRDGADETHQRTAEAPLYSNWKPILAVYACRYPCIIIQERLYRHIIVEQVAKLYNDERRWWK